MLTLEIGRTISLPLNLKGTTIGSYLKMIEETHNVTLYNYNPTDNLIAYTGELEALNWFLRNELHLGWDDIESHIISTEQSLPPLWNLFTFSDLLRMNEWAYTMTRLKGYVSPYQYKMQYSKEISGQTIIVKIPFMRLDPQICIFKVFKEELTPLASFNSDEQYLPFQDAIEYLNTLNTTTEQ